MLRKTQGIVLHHFRHTGPHHMVHMYTREEGRQTFLLTGIHSKKKKQKPVFLQPLFILDLDYYFHDRRDVQRIKEFHPAWVWRSIPFDIKKNTIALFLGEVLYHVLKTEEKDPSLYRFLKNSIQYLEAAKEGTNNFHLWFLLRMSQYLGFYPRDNYNSLFDHFDLQNGEYVGAFLPHSDILKAEEAVWLHRFQQTELHNISGIRIDGKKRNQLLNGILRYYRCQLPGIPQINSLDILKSLFHGAP